MYVSYTRLLWLYFTELRKLYMRVVNGKETNWRRRSTSKVIPQRTEQKVIPLSDFNKFISLPPPPPSALWRQLSLCPSTNPLSPSISIHRVAAYSIIFLPIIISISLGTHPQLATWRRRLWIFAGAINTNCKPPPTEVVTNCDVKWVETHFQGILDWF